MRTTDLEHAAADIRDRGARTPFVERIEGETFVAHPPTPLLERTLDRVRAALDTAARAAGVAAATALHDPLVVAGRHLVVPDLVLRDAGGTVRLVVELRSESTERYALGVKRLVYQAAGIGEYWFLEPRARRLQALWPEAGGDYGWPPAVYPDGATVRLRSLPKVTVAVADLLPLPGRNR